MSCLLCGSYYEEPLRFSDILSLKPSQHRLCTDCYQGFEKVSKSHCPTCFKTARCGQKKATPFIIKRSFSTMIA